jgi:hypothetical protein
MLRHTLNSLHRNAPRKTVSRAAAFLGIAVLTLALSGCSMFHRAKPGSEVGAEVKHPAGSNEPYPKLGSVPDRPKDSESADSRREIARSLVADRDAAHYADQALRGGTEASAPPPPPPVAGFVTPATGAIDEDAKTKSASADENKPGFFGRLFHHSKPKADDAATPAPLPAQPTKPVESGPAPAVNSP